LTSTSGSFITIEMEYRLDGLKWKCLTCGEVAGLTSYDYVKLLKHKKGHQIHLANEITGEITAKNPKRGVCQGG